MMNRGFHNAKAVSCGRNDITLPTRTSVGSADGPLAVLHCNLKRNAAATSRMNRYHRRMLNLPLAHLLNAMVKSWEPPVNRQLLKRTEELKQALLLVKAYLPKPAEKDLPLLQQIPARHVAQT